MEFTVEMEGVRLSCVSPWCIQRLTQLGWRLADPSQADQLKAELSAREAASCASGKLHRLEPEPTQGSSALLSRGSPGPVD
jgi:hypothetical protein